MITGSEQPDSGAIRLGETVQIAAVDQSRDSLDDDKTVWEEISDGQDLIKVGSYETPSRAYVGRFNFRGPEQQKKIGLLSGGERNRVHLAKMLKSGGNLLMLDEPTNDLDVETLRALEEADLPAYKWAVNSVEVGTWAGFPWPHSDATVERWFDDVRERHGLGEYWFAISPLGSDEFIGTIWLWSRKLRSTSWKPKNGR